MVLRKWLTDMRQKKSRLVSSQSTHNVQNGNLCGSKNSLRKQICYTNYV